MALTRPGWTRYQQSLSGVEQSWYKALNKEYRAIRGDLVDVLDRYGLSQVARSQVRDVYAGLRTTAQGIAGSQVSGIIKAGETYTALQVAYLNKHQIISLSRVPVLTQMMRGSLTAVMSSMEWVDSAMAFMLSGMSTLKLSGETKNIIETLLSVKLRDGRAGPYRKAQTSMRQEIVMRTWGGGSNVLGQLYGIVDDNVDQELMRQAVSAIDERTTSCCLEVHGQIVRQKERFKLIGTPRFRDEMLNPPFHWYCRSATAIYQDRMETIPGNITTQMMRESARAEVIAREDGSRVEIHPAHATSRR